MPSLEGTWRTDPGDHWSLREYGDVSLRFERGGKLVYTVHLSGREQIIHLRYREDGHHLVTDQPSAPRQDTAEFHFTPDGRLVIKSQGDLPPTYYVRR